MSPENFKSENFKSEKFGFEDFKKLVPVSRETEDKLKCYADLLVKWNKAINLVGRDTISDLWRRHFLDSAQLAQYFPKISSQENNSKPVIVDFGSGAGFPAIVLAILGVGDVHAMESDIKKSTFLREVSRETNTPLTVHNQRIEKITPFAVNFFTARAFASLDKIIDFAQPFIEVSSRETPPEFLLLKGRSVDQELTEAEKKWSMSLSRYKSLSDSEATILRLKLL
ncbi:16S rRNA (guanine(527)-N(7))-methyltransferase RsmG [Kiloniella laminariae]|uniref:16S rRNA (guanine(527)-N(7))-methyltransferase RsmG n=1 Tax=Kiloniella laminariae TaxID=454162 RepID=UPI00037ED44C|nr:16S rRNA (guanine(527)-N(7))-methyltransferase RsmG [Kiloniella laminariae]